MEKLQHSTRQTKGEKLSSKASASLDAADFVKIEHRAIIHGRWTPPARNVNVRRIVGSRPTTIPGWQRTGNKQRGERALRPPPQRRMRRQSPPRPNKAKGVQVRPQGGRDETRPRAALLASTAKFRASLRRGGRHRAAKQMSTTGST